MRTTPLLQAVLRCLTLALAFVLVSGLAAGRAEAQTGKITGVVTDAGTGQPIEGAQVLLQGTGYGQVSGPNGRFFILGVPPATYTVQARRIGYGTQQTTVVVTIDVTREINFKLSSAANTLQTVQIVENQQNLVELKQTGTTQSISQEELQTLPVRSIKDALQLQAGFTEVPQVSTDLTSFTSARRQGITGVQIRGGRAGETMTLIDDIPINNFLFGGPSMDITNKAIAGVSTVKGGMEPQYGNALSGVVSMATRDGGTTIQGALDYETSKVGKAFGGISDGLKGYDFIEGFLSGPVPATNNKLRFVLAGRSTGGASQVLEYDNKVFDPFMSDTIARAISSGDLLTGWRAQGYTSERDAFAKLTYLFGPTTKLSVSALHFENARMNVAFDWGLMGYSRANQCIDTYRNVYRNVDVNDACNTYYDTDRLTPTGRPTGADRNTYVAPATVSEARDLLTARFEQTAGRFNYKIVVGQLSGKRQTCATFFSGVCIGERVADTNFDGRFAVAGVTSVDITPTEGTDEIAGHDQNTTRLARFDVQYQATDHHNLAMGVFYQGHDILFREVRDVGLNNIQLQPSNYAAKPWDAAAYLQDRIEYDFLTVRIGARFDYGRAGGVSFNNPLDPTNGTTQLSVCNDPAKFGLPANWASGIDPVTKLPLTGIAACGVLQSKGDSARDIAFKDDLGQAAVRRAFSPRLGLSFPVTDRSNAFFNFGVYYQNPLYNNVYQGTGIGTAAEGTAKAVQFDAQTYVGNPRLRAEQAVSYEMGYVAEFGKGNKYALQFVAFSKDQSGLTGIRNGGFLKGTITRVFDPGVTYGTNSPSYTVLVNQDFQTVRGFELEFRRRLSNFWTGRLNYAFSQATTNASPPDLETQRTTEEGDIVARREIRSDVDQQHQLGGSVSFIVANKTPGIWGGQYLKNSSVSFTTRLASGFPYTPSLTFTGNAADRLERNSGTAPLTFIINMQAQKDWTIANVRYGAFLRVANLLDRRNCSQVFATTGNCDGGASPQARLQSGNF
ncbi:MAG: TonB-dependent receptor, partial [Gemmatimonadota bacterium]|nr:TonB-dependent receptor [Gemmatimonadota bacterium]